MATVEKVYIGDEKFLREQEHFCPNCGEKLSICKLSWTVKPKENTNLSEYHPDGFKYVLYKFKCVPCAKIYSQPEIKRIEKAAAEDAAKKAAGERKQTKKMCKKAAKKVAKKMTRDIERDIYRDMKLKYGLEKPKKKPLEDAINKVKSTIASLKPKKEEKQKRDIHISFSFHKN